MQALWRAAYVAIGSNLQSPAARVAEAMQRLECLPATRLLSRSRSYASRPMGPQDQPAFVNAAAGLLTQLPPRELLSSLLQVECSMGRTRQAKWGPRIIDLDLLWMAGEVIDEPGLRLPHPGVSSRNFVLYPLADIAPALLIAGHGTVQELKAKAGADGIAEWTPES